MPLVNGMAEVICRIGLSLILTRIAFIGYWGIWYTTAATWFVTAMVSLYKIQGWKMEASFNCKIDFHNCCTDWVRQFFLVETVSHYI